MYATMAVGLATSHEKKKEVDEGWERDESIRGRCTAACASVVLTLMKMKVVCSLAAMWHSSELLWGSSTCLRLCHALQDSSS